MMDWHKLPVALVRSPCFRCAGAASIGTWVRVLGLCMEMENGGRILGAETWPSRIWNALAGCSRPAVLRMVADGLATWEGGDLHVLGFDRAAQSALAEHRQTHPGRPLPVSPGGILPPLLSEAQRQQRVEAARRRWAGRAAGAGVGTGAIAPAAGAPAPVLAPVAGCPDAEPHAENDAEPHAERHAEHAEHAEPDAERHAESDAEPHAAGSVSLRPTSSEEIEREEFREERIKKTRAHVFSDSVSGSDADSACSACDSASGSASLSACGSASPVSASGLVGLAGEVARPPPIPVPVPVPRPPAPPGGGPPLDVGPPAASAAGEAGNATWEAAQADGWIDLLRAAGCKVGQRNWRQWAALRKRWGDARLLHAADQVQATERWPDGVENVLRKPPSLEERLGSRLIRIPALRDA